ncbi:protein IQ-DOMAIN 14 [Cucumis sativus]|uniref:protein IQ-DOMAIN 14 n=1 Tax=Cucumis sativus TaxID=3659 RepID=UPI0002B4B050|nr:protein IQ-DOMAIN 14 [Cucumis sativus]KAE8650451.1 hypothetical protein Csa_010561 [Cucumis sativus]
MGFLRRLFRPNKPPPALPDSTPGPNIKKNKRWSFGKSGHNHHSRPYATSSQPNAFGPSSSYTEPLDANKHAIAVAAATAAVAEAALAAAHAAAEVVRLTSSGTTHSNANRRWMEDAAAVKIQSAFRGYLARRALRALKALVKLQALVRGHIVRKQMADMLRRMQTLVRLQSRACAGRSNLSDSLHSTSKSSLSHIRVQATPNGTGDQLCAHHSNKFDNSALLKRCGSNSNLKDVTVVDRAPVGSSWLDRWMEENLWNNRQLPLKNIHAVDEKTDKILEVDTWKPHLKSQGNINSFKNSQMAPDFRNHQSFMTIDSPSKHSSKAANPVSSLSSGEVSLSSLKFPVGKYEQAPRTAENSPQVHSASSRRGNTAKRATLSPTRSEYAWGYFSGYAGYPNYMANTESSKAKVRSQSAPKQRLELEKFGSNKRYAQVSWDAWSFSNNGISHEPNSSNNANSVADRMTKFASTKSR